MMTKEEKETLKQVLFGADRPAYELVRNDLIERYGWKDFYDLQSAVCREVVIANEGLII